MSKQNNNIPENEDYGNDIVILDTAGRLHVDTELMDELQGLKDEFKPEEILLVIDSMTGQDAVNVAAAFNEKLGITAIAYMMGLSWGTLAGWRTYTPPTTAYAHTSLTLHIPVALCDGNKETYRLVAVLNQSTWGDIVDADGNPLTLNSETTYTQLIGARFANQALIEQAIEENTPGTPSTPDNPGTSGDPGNPEAMPVSHWCDVEVTKDNTHASGQCATANLDVFRSVAKTQLFVTKTSNDFSLEITGVTVNAANKPTEGMLLSSLDASVLGAENANPTPEWFSGSPAKDTTNALSQSLKNQTDGFNTVSLPAAEGDPAETFVGSAFLYENAEGFTVDYASYDYTTAPTGSNGYYLTINYTVDGDAKEGHVPLPSVVRNHDYQVHLTVDKSGANLEMLITIAAWNKTKHTYGEIVIGGSN